MVTAGLVNFIVLPPKYYQQIEDNLTQSEYKMYELFSSRCNELLLGKFDSDHSNDLLNKLMGVINKTETLTGYQKDELRYHKNKEDEWKRLKIFRTVPISIDYWLLTYQILYIYLSTYI